MIKEVDILEQLIAGIEHKITVEGVVNSATQSTLTVCNSLYLNTGKVVTIASIDYKIVSFTVNETLVLEPVTTTDPLVSTATTSFTIDPPKFRHGTPQMVNAEHTIDQADISDKWPLIWLLEFQEILVQDDPEPLVRSTLQNASLFFLDSAKYGDWTIEEHYNEVIYPQFNELELVIKGIRARRDLFAELTTHIKTAHTNFGVFTTNRGNTVKILSDQLSGAEMRIDLEYVVELCDDCDEVVVCPVTGGGTTYTYDVFLNSVDTGEDVLVDGTDITINLS